jgi:D-beta-D-heptose 7-phosphate kinase/D-beta-D-heptose 1-phosphate adenosyltransferase
MELKSNNISIKYHNIFDYKLSKDEAFKWQFRNQKTVVSGKKNKSRLQREKYSQKKLLIAKKASKLISKIPTVLFVGITGSLAMMNSGKNSDIDLMIITKKNCLWTTRLLVYGLLRVTGYELRKPKLNNEKDMLCINLWLDESDLVWGKKDRNIYTAHEIAQVVPLFNKDKTYEKFLYLNRWILNYWPNSVDAKYIGRSISYIGNTKTQYTIYHILNTVIEYLAFNIQYWYMKNKITREIVTPTRAIFHPNDWGKKVLIALGRTNC